MPRYTIECPCCTYETEVEIEEGQVLSVDCECVIYIEELYRRTDSGYRPALEEYDEMVLERARNAEIAAAENVAEARAERDWLGEAS